MTRELIEILNRGLDVVPGTHCARMWLQRGCILPLSDEVAVRYLSVCHQSAPDAQPRYEPQLELRGAAGTGTLGLVPLSLGVWCGLRVIPRAVCWRDGQVPERVLLELQRINALWEVQPWAA